MEIYLSRLAEGGAVFGAAVALSLILLAPLAVLWRRRRGPDELERARRLRLNARGRLTTGEVIDIEEVAAPAGGPPRKILHYGYQAGAARLTANQDVTLILDRVGDDPGGIIGPAAVKYDPKNPYDSIVACEAWNGLRGRGGPELRDEVRPRSESSTAPGPPA